MGTLFPLVTPTPAWGWGHQGHSIVAHVGAQLATDGRDFWVANIDSLGTLTNVPDNRWKRKDSYAQEGPNHWFQIDSYYDNPSQYLKFPRAYGVAVDTYGEKTIQKNGTAPWRILQFYDAAVAAIRSGDYETGLQMAGIMSHYIGDLSQPLHVSENYDGKETNDKGIHKFFETDNIEANIDGLENEVLDVATKLIKQRDFRSDFSGTLLETSFNEVNRAIAFKDAIYKIDLNKRLGRGDAGAEAQLKIAKPRLADGAATLGMILGQLWRDAGSPDYGASVKVDAPDFVAPDFDVDATDRRKPSPTEGLMDYLMADDC